MEKMGKYSISLARKEKINRWILKVWTGPHNEDSLCLFSTPTHSAMFETCAFVGAKSFFTIKCKEMEKSVVPILTRDDKGNFSLIPTSFCFSLN